MRVLQVASGEAAAAIVYQDGMSMAFLDNRPLFAGHCLLIPRQHRDTILDLPAEEVEPLFATARRLCAAVESALGAEGSFLAINTRVSQSVPHLHIHVVPRRRKDGLKGFFWPRAKYRDDAEMESVRDALERAMK